MFIAVKCVILPFNYHITMNQTDQRHISTNIISLIAVFLLMAAAAIMHNGRLLGHDITHSGQSVSDIKISADTVTINTSSLCPDITGYAGPVPVEINIASGRIVSVMPLDNAETPSFFKKVTSSGLPDRWTGLTPSEAASLHVDAVAGATYSSHALIANVQAGIARYMSDHNDIITQGISPKESHRDARFYCMLAVLIAAMSLPLVIKNRRYRIIQQLLNAGVLGFWGGTFVDYTMMLGVMSNGIVSLASVTTVLMLVAAFIYPLFGKKGYYCAWVCPLGSLQELASDCNPHHRIHLSPATVKTLTTFRMILWGALMICLWTGMWMSWIDYELFTAFMVREAATGVLIAGAAVVLLSVWIPRPYCRFICPTGTLLRTAQDIDTK